MIETLREFVQAVLLTLAVLCVVAVVVFYSVGAGLINTDRQAQRESQYRAACEEAKGKVVWNGNHWECLK